MNEFIMQDIGGRISPWNPIETVPKDGTAVDLWVRGTITQREWRIADAMWDSVLWLAGKPIDCWQDGCGRRFYPDRVTPLAWMLAPSRQSGSETSAGTEAQAGGQTVLWPHFVAGEPFATLQCGTVTVRLSYSALRLMKGWLSMGAQGYGYPGISQSILDAVYAVSREASRLSVAKDQGGAMIDPLEDYKKAYALEIGKNMRLRDELDNIKEWASGLQSVIQSLKECASWKSIETAPKNVRRILLYEQDSSYQIYIGYWDSYRAYWVDRDGVRSEATHWMPLPAPPPEAETSAVEGEGA